MTASLGDCQLHVSLNYKRTDILQGIVMKSAPFDSYGLSGPVNQGSFSESSRNTGLEVATGPASARRSRSGKSPSRIITSVTSFHVGTLAWVPLGRSGRTESRLLCSAGALRLAVRSVPHLLPLAASRTRTLRLISPSVSSPLSHTCCYSAGWGTAIPTHSPSLAGAVLSAAPQTLARI